MSCVAWQIDVAMTTVRQRKENIDGAVARQLNAGIDALAAREAEILRARWAIPAIPNRASASPAIRRCSVPSSASRSALQRQPRSGTSWRRGFGAGCPRRTMAAAGSALRACGLSAQKQGYAKSLAQAVLDGELDFAALPADDEGDRAADQGRASDAGRPKSIYFRRRTPRRPGLPTTLRCMTRWPHPSARLRARAKRVREIGEASSTAAPPPSSAGIVQYGCDLTLAELTGPMRSFGNAARWSPARAGVADIIQIPQTQRPGETPPGLCSPDARLISSPRPFWQAFLTAAGFSSASVLAAAFIARALPGRLRPSRPWLRPSPLPSWQPAFSPAAFLAGLAS